jgi:tetratricopeptide (TPR) repeat protein
MTMPEFPRRGGNNTREGGWIWLLLFLGLALVGVFMIVSFVKASQKQRNRAIQAATAKTITAAQTNEIPKTNFADNVAPTNAGIVAETNSPSFEISTHDKAMALAQRGDAFLNQGRFSDAIQAYREALKIEPEAEDMQYNLAIALARAGKTDEAIAVYKEALRLVPDYAEAHNNLGNLLVKKGQFDEAVDHFKEAIRINPEHAPSHNNLGTAYARQGKAFQAAEAFGKAVALDPNYLEARCNLGNSYSSQGRIPEAKQQYQEILRINPQFGPARQGLANLARKEQGQK